MEREDIMSDNDTPFTILGAGMAGPGSPERGPRPEGGDSVPVGQRIKQLIGSFDVFLFMKGTPEFPECGFSANVVGILNSLGVEFRSFNILLDSEIRLGVKEYSSWPTYPQLYVKGELMGGNDIVTEMFESGELQKILS